MGIESVPVQDEIVVGATRKRSWADKFRDAFQGLRLAVLGQSSFVVHFTMAVLVLTMAAVFQCTYVEWSLLLLCIGSVVAAEIANSAIEALGKAVDREHNRQLGSALDMASAAVLVLSATAAIVGLIVFSVRIYRYLNDAAS